MRCTLLWLLLAGCSSRDLGIGAVAAWPMIGHDAQHTSASTFVGTSTPTVTFDFASGDDGFVSDPVIDAAGLVYVALGARNAAAQLYSLDPSRPSDPSLWSAAPCDFPDVRAAIGGDANLYATCAGLLDASEVVSLTKHGDMRWRVTSGVSDATAPVLGSDGTIYVGSTGISAYSSAGALLWQTGQDLVPVPPALGEDGVVYFADLSGQVHALLPSGVESWVTQVDSAPLGGGCGVTMGHDDDLFACFPNGLLARLGTDARCRRHDLRRRRPVARRLRTRWHAALHGRAVGQRDVARHPGLGPARRRLVRRDRARVRTVMGYDAARAQAARREQTRSAGEHARARGRRHRDRLR